jgi:DNA-binding CsgD family transcriptional regulator
LADDLESALEITGDIYDAALDPGLWPEVLGRITLFVGGVTTALMSQDVVAQSARFYFSWGDDPDHRRLYFEKYVKLNPLLGALMLLKLGDVRAASSVLPMEKFRTTRFYKEWAGPAGYGDVTAALTDRTGSVATHLSTWFADEKSPIGKDSLRRAALLVPHVRRAVSIGNVIDMHRVEADGLAEAVDAMAAAVFLVREDGHVVRANSGGRDLAEDGGLLRIEGGRLSTAGSTGRRELHMAVAGAALGDLIIGRRGIAIPLIDREEERYVAHVLPLTSGLRRKAGISTGAVAAIFVHSATMNTELPIEAVSRQFDLSAAELRVLVAVLDFGSPAEVAAILGLSEATIRTHLRRLYQKTGTSRQSDLVKLVAGYANPLVAPAA